MRKWANEALGFSERERQQGEAKVRGIEQVHENEGDGQHANIYMYIYIHMYIYIYICVL